MSPQQQLNPAVGILNIFRAAKLDCGCFQLTCKTFVKTSQPQQIVMRKIDIQMIPVSPDSKIRHDHGCAPNGLTYALHTKLRKKGCRRNKQKSYSLEKSFQNVFEAHAFTSQTVSIYHDAGNSTIFTKKDRQSHGVID
jgi:hypothetical protein